MKFFISLLTKYNNTKIKLPQWKNTINQYENTIIQLMENKVSSSLNNYEYKEDALNHKEISSSLFNYINSQPNFYKIKSFHKKEKYLFFPNIFINWFKILIQI